MSESLFVRGRVGWLQSWLATRQGVSLGRWGEWIALRYLLYQGYDVIARNWTTHKGELDLVAYDQDFLVFCEVKTRHLPARFPPEYTVTETKRNRIYGLALRFLHRFELEGTPVRFDLIAIETSDRREFGLRHYRGITEY